MSMAVSLAEKSVVVIEDLFLAHCCEIEDMHKLPKEKITELLAQIYAIVHSANPDHICWDAHIKWRKETYKMYEERNHADTTL